MLALVPFATLTGAAGLRGPNYLSTLEQLERQVRDLALLARARALLSDDVAGFTATFGPQAASTGVQTAGYLPFRQHPLSRLSGGAAAPISLPLLQEETSIGAYWILHEHYRKADPKEGVRTFTAAIGSLFQEYLTALLQRTFASRPGRQRFFDEDTHSWALSPVRVCASRAAGRVTYSMAVSSRCAPNTTLFPPPFKAFTATSAPASTKAPASR